MKKYKLICSIVLIALCIIPVQSENVKTELKIDSLKSLLLLDISDSSYVKHLNEIAWDYRSVDIDSSTQYAKKALVKNNNRYPKSQLKSYNTLGVLRYYSSEFDSCIYYFKKALDICAITEDKEAIAKTCNNIGTIYQMTGKYPESLEFNLRSLTTKEEIKDSIGIINSCINIASLYYQLDKFNDALIYNKRGIAIAEIIAPKKLPILYNSLGVQHKELKDYEQALVFINKALILNQENKDDKRIAICYQNLADTYMALGKFNVAMEHYRKALIEKQKIGNEKSLAKTHMAMGILAFKMGSIDECLNYLSKAESFYSKSKQLFELKSIYNYQSKAYAVKKNSTKAYDHLLMASEISDSIFNVQNKQIIEELETKYQTEQKEHQIAKLNQEKLEDELLIKDERLKSIIAIIVLVVIILLAATVIYIIVHRGKKRRHKAELREKELIEKARVDIETITQKKNREKVTTLERELKLLSQEIHDSVLSDLTGVKFLLGGKTPNNERAVLHLSKSIDKLRNISHQLNTPEFEYNTLEIAIESYLSQFENCHLTIDFSCVLKKELGKLMQIAIYRVIQESVKNTLKHSDADKCMIAINQNNNQIQLLVKDNGKKLTKSKSGIGLQNMNERVESLNGSIEVQNKNGFEINICFPIAN